VPGTTPANAYNVANQGFKTANSSFVDKGPRKIYAGPELSQKGELRRYGKTYGNEKGTNG